jgi:hypothetical protein
LPQNQDPITPNVAFTRGSAQGLYNIAQEMFYTPNLSPKSTTWATSLNNPGKTIASTNWANLSFTNWQTAYGGPTQLAGNITNLDAVVHLVANDIYLDLRFDYWGQRSDSGTAFSYFRSSVPEAHCRHIFKRQIAKLNQTRQSHRNRGRCSRDDQAANMMPPTHITALTGSGMGWNKRLSKANRPLLPKPSGKPTVIRLTAEPLYVNCPSANIGIGFSARLIVPSETFDASKSSTVAPFVN